MRKIIEYYCDECECCYETEAEALECETTCRVNTIDRYRNEIHELKELLSAAIIVMPEGEVKKRAQQRLYGFLYGKKLVENRNCPVDRVYMIQDETR